MVANKPKLTESKATGAVTALLHPSHSPSQSSSGAHPVKKSYHFVPHKKHSDSMLSCRYELKYRIRETKARAVAQYIQSYISPDKYARKRPGYAYPISSLYFDSDHLHLCNETIAGKKNRFKLRIRCYDSDPESMCFFEIKRRINNVILKDRARLPKSQILNALAGSKISAPLYKKDEMALNQFRFYIKNLCARPILMVRYQREAYEGNSSNRVRITFDRQLDFRTVNAPEVTTDGADWHNVPMNFVVLEIKFTDRYPFWLTDMVKMFDLKQTAMSKYVSTVKQSCSAGFCNPTYLHTPY
jgi:SPX domain protein involved in polyphosphate accumulation